MPCLPSFRRPLTACSQPHPPLSTVQEARPQPQSPVPPNPPRGHPVSCKRPRLSLPPGFLTHIFFGGGGGSQQNGAQMPPISDIHLSPHGLQCATSSLVTKY